MELYFYSDNQKIIDVVMSIDGEMKSMRRAICTIECVWWWLVFCANICYCLGNGAKAYFAQKLLDYDLSANVGNWQWAANLWL